MREKLKENILETEAYFQRYGGEWFYYYFYCNFV
jgi:hypothetical protein